MSKKANRYAAIDGDRIRALIIGKGHKTLGKFATAIGSSHTTVSHIVAGETVRGASAVAAALTLGVPIEELFRDVDDKPEPAPEPAPEPEPAPVATMNGKFPLEGQEVALVAMRDGVFVTRCYIVDENDGVGLILKPRLGGAQDGA